MSFQLWDMPTSNNIFCYMLLLVRDKMLSTQYRKISGTTISHIYVKQKENDFSVSQTVGFHDTCGILGSVTDHKIQILYPKKTVKFWEK